MHPLSIDERLCAAAHTILNDGLRHAPEATAWALSTLGRDEPAPTEGTPLSPAERGAPLPRRWDQLTQPLSLSERRIARRWPTTFHTSRSTTTPRRGNHHVPA